MSSAALLERYSPAADVIVRLVVEALNSKKHIQPATINGPVSARGIPETRL